VQVASARLEKQRTRRLDDVEIDPYRAFIFPNRIRDERRRGGFARLLHLSQKIIDIPYIRLSKIERGEVFARPAELVRIAQALGVAAGNLLIDVDSPEFDIARWAEPFIEDRSQSAADEERLAVVLAAALRARRASDRTLTIATLERNYGLPPVILSRLENAQKPLDRWNRSTVAALCSLFGVADEADLRELVLERYARGELDAYVGTIATAAERRQRTSERMGALVADLAAAVPGAELKPEPPVEIEEAPPPPVSRRLPVLGAPLADGLIGLVITDMTVEAPAAAGPRAFGLRVFRATLGGGLPGQATVIVDPDRYPVAGGLAAVREREGFRLMTVTLDRTGCMIGSSLVPDREIALDGLPPTDVAAVIAAYFL
jgi:hypothetical protein